MSHGKMFVLLPLFLLLAGADGGETNCDEYGCSEKKCVEWKCSTRNAWILTEPCDGSGMEMFVEWQGGEQFSHKVLDLAGEVLLELPEWDRPYTTEWTKWHEGSGAPCDIVPGDAGERVRVADDGCHLMHVKKSCARHKWVNEEKRVSVREHDRSSQIIEESTYRNVTHLIDGKIFDARNELLSDRLFIEKLVTIVTSQVLSHLDTDTYT